MENNQGQTQVTTSPFPVPIRARRADGRASACAEHHGAGAGGIIPIDFPPSSSRACPGTRLDFGWVTKWGSSNVCFRPKTDIRHRIALSVAQAGFGNGGNVLQVSAAAAAENVDTRKALPEIAM